MKLWGNRKSNSIYKTYLSDFFSICDLRSGQFHDLPIISQWRKFQLPLNVIQCPQYARDHVITGPCWWFIQEISPVTFGRSSLGHPRSPDVTNGFSGTHNFWLKRDRSSGQRPLCSYRQCRSNDTHYDQFGSGHHLDLRSNFKCNLLRSTYTSFDAS